jgi:hypothetical protein
MMREKRKKGMATIVVEYKTKTEETINPGEDSLSEGMTGMIEEAKDPNHAVVLIFQPADL